MVREEPSVLVSSHARPFEPGGEGGVTVGARRLRLARVRDLARECMLDDVLALTRQRRAGATAHEVPLFEQPEIGLHSLDEFVDGPRPEHPPDHRSGLQSRLLRGGKQVDARSEHSVNGVGNAEPLGKFADQPAAVGAPKGSRVEQRRNQLLEEERVPFGTLDDHGAERIR
jgi:hypothetical protein